jgi:hypothetical protein
MKINPFYYYKLDFRELFCIFFDKIFPLREFFYINRCSN